MIKVGHRGARAYEPENTLQSFKRAIELGVDGVELDVRKTKDDVIVVIHDSDVKRTTNGSGQVCDLTLREIKSFSTDKNDKIPTLEEALEFLDKKVKVFVELKETGLEEKTVSLIKKHEMKKKRCHSQFSRRRY